jgi:bidirectional [NiFe] hydrogenase diaphorase subunit
VSELTIEINGQLLQVPENTTIIEAAKTIGINIPSLCHKKDVLPYGACRLCLVEIEISGKSSLVASCGYYVKEGLKVKTDSPRVLRTRKLMVELLYSMMPESKFIQKLANEFKIEKSRYNRDYSYCILCGLCVRHCEEVKGKNAIGFTGRGQDREVTWVPLSTYDTACADCFECISLCPTGVFPSNWGASRLNK